MVERFVYGEYADFEHMQVDVDRLLANKVPKKVMTIAAKRDILDAIDSSIEVVDEHHFKDEVDNRNWWAKLFNSSQEDEINYYKRTIKNGEILLIIDETYHDLTDDIQSAMSSTTRRTTAHVGHDDEIIGSQEDVGERPPSSSKQVDRRPILKSNDGENIDLESDVENFINDDMVYGSDYVDSSNFDTSKNEVKGHLKDE